MSKDGRHNRHGSLEELGLQETRAALRESRENYRVLFESINEGFCVIEVIFSEDGRPVDYRFLEVNPTFEQQSGIVDPIGRTVRELVPGFDQIWVDLYGEVARTRVPQSFTSESVAMGRWFEAEALPIGERGSNKVAVLFNDITARRKAEAERDEVLRQLNAERAQLMTIFQEAPAAIAVLRGPDFVFESANPLYYKLVGHREIRGKPVKEALPEAADQGFLDLLSDVYRTGRPYEGSGVRILLQAEPGATYIERFVDFVYQPLRDADGNVNGIFAHAVDVTEHREAIEGLARAHAEMEKTVEERTAEMRAANDELAAFNYSVSHDLCAPLRGIDGFSVVLEEEFADALGDDGLSYLKRIRDNTRRMGELIEDLLQLSRLTGQPLSRSPVNLTALVSSVLDGLAELHPDRKVRTKVHSGMHVRGDDGLLRTALENLLGNAWKFTVDIPDAEIEVGEAGEQGERYFFVRDNGAGFDMRYADKLFVAFQRLHTPGKYAGTGVGLAIVQRVINKHGGRIWAEGEPGKGATFYFTLG